MSLILRGINSPRRISVNYSHDPPSLGSLCNDYLQGIGCCTEDCADLGAVLDEIQDSYRERPFQYNAEDMPCTYGSEVFYAQVDKCGVVALGPDEAGPGGLSEGYSKLCLGDCFHSQRLALAHPRDRSRLVEIVAPMPADMVAVLSAARESAPAEQTPE